MTETLVKKKKTAKFTRQALGKRLLDMDWYGEPVAFNFAGEERIPSIPGCFLTSILLLTLLAYGMTSFQSMIVHNNPLITIADI